MPNIHDDNRAIIEAGYTPQLKRSLGPFSSFAIPFSEISITTGIFANFGFVLTKAGPFGFWTWLIAGFGFTMVALIFAEMAGRVPLAGSVYNWNNMLAHPVIGWFSGWLAMIGFAIGTAAVTSTILPLIGVIMGYDLDPHVATCIAVALIVAQLVINLYGARLTSQINIIAVIAEIVSMLGLGVMVLIAVMRSGEFHFNFLTTIPANPAPYWPGFLMSILIGGWTMVGFECAADVGEETINAQHVTPKGMVTAVLVSTFVGFAFLVVMAVSIPDLPEATQATYPLATIVTHYLGNTGTNVFLAFAMTSMFACSMIVMMTGARILFAIARDGRFIASPFFSKVSAHHVPKNASLLIAILAIIFVTLGDGLTMLAGAGTVCATVYYLLTVVSFGITAPKLPDTHTFSLGRWHWPVVILAVIWLVSLMSILTIPEEFHPIALTAGGVVAVGIALFPFVGRVRPKSH